MNTCRFQKRRTCSPWGRHLGVLELASVQESVQESVLGLVLPLAPPACSTPFHIRKLDLRTQHWYRACYP